MGNKLSRKRHVVDERYTKPQGLYQNRDIDHKKLRKLILDAKLAPCYPGSEERLSDLEECPICFLFYPSLNRSKCCLKGICTECFLQMKAPSSNRPTQCPFCKTANYAVEYRGLRTQEEKISEQAEEQKVIEAKIKMQQQELKEENERIHKKREALYVAQVSPSQVVDSQNQQNFNAVSDGFQMTSNSSPDLNEIHPFSDISGTTANVQGSSSGPLENRPTCSSTELPMTRSQPLAARHNRDDDFDLDLEDIMVMEAIWLSIQEQGTQRFNGSATVPDADYSSRFEQMSRSVDCPEIRGSCPAVTNSRETVPNSSVTGGLACAIAALAERQAVNNDSRQNFESQQAERNSEECESMSGNELAYNREVEEQQQACTENSDDMDSEIGERGHQFHTPDNWIEVSLESGRALSPCAREGSQCSTSDCVVDHSSEVVEVGTSFSSSIRSTSDMPWVPEVAQNCDGSVEQSTLNSQSSVVPESYEEQIMLAIAISLAEAQAQS